MLFEVVQTRPFLVWAWAVLAKAQVHHLRTAFWLLVVNTLLVAGQVIDRAESLFTRAVGFITFEQLSVASLMLSIQGQCSLTRETRNTAYLLSDGHFPTHEQVGWSHLTAASGE